MPLVYDKVHGFRFPAVEQRYTTRDTILYALGVGYGTDPLDERELAFVYEKRLQAAPTLALALGFQSLRAVDLGVDYSKVVHGTQKLEVHELPPAEGAVTCTATVEDVWDMGAGKGALLNIVRRITDSASGRLLATSTMGALCRADGGFGGPPAPAKPRPVPETAPDHVFTWRSLPQQALLFRLSGDYNPLHADPAFARSVGFQRPVLHGLATFGAAARALLATLCGHDARRLKSIEGRFTAPFLPGETLEVRIWCQADGVRFRAAAAERGVVVIDHGAATVIS